MYITKDDLKEFCGLTTAYPWENVYLEICYSNNGVVRAYLKGESLPFYAGGRGYDKYGVVLSDFLNYYVGHKVSKNSGEGVEATVKDAARAGIKIEEISETKGGQLYKISMWGKGRL